MINGLVTCIRKCLFLGFLLLFLSFILLRNKKVLCIEEKNCKKGQGILQNRDRKKRKEIKKPTKNNALSKIMAQ